MKKTIYNFMPVLALIIAISCDSSYTDSGASGDPSSSSGKGGSLARFAIVDNSLFALTENSLKYFDITNPALPLFIDSSELGNDIETLFSYGDYLFLGTQNGMIIYDAGYEGFPAHLSRYEHIRSCDPVVAEDNYAYVTLNSNNSWCGRSANMLEIIDITNISSPVKIAEYTMQGPMGLGIDGNLLFVCDNGLKVYDVTNKNNIELKQYFDIEATDVIPYNNMLIVTGDDGLYQYSYSGSELKLLSKIPVEKEVTP
ncbi:MAG: hypothetical protein JXB00_17935 [Bacteroidales bacterium]|nr:hypothetical protein [Bacteroidales bacterium]